MTCNLISQQKVPIRAIVDMGIRLKATRNSPQHRLLVLDRLHQLSPNELDVCRLHLLEGHSQRLVAEWLGVTERLVRRYLTHAVLKVPELRPLRKKSMAKIQRPRILQLSQLKGNDKGPFNADEL